VTTGTAADIVVLTALDLEFAAVRAHLTDVRREVHGTGTIFEVGTPIGGAGRVAVAVIGPGNARAAVLADRAIERFRPEALLFVGVAGALHDDVEVGDVVVATEVYAYHGGREHAAGFGARPRVYEAPHRLDQLTRAVARDGGWGRPGSVVHFRPIAAGEVVLTSRDGPLAQRLAQQFDDAAAIEMEGAGIAQAGQLNDASKVLIIRGVSDRADVDKYEADRAGYQRLAAERAAAFAFDLIAALLPAGTSPPGRPAPPRQAPARAVRAEPAGPPTDTVWRPIPGPAEVRWRTDRAMPSYASESPALELHLVPVGGPLDVRRLGALAEELAGAGRRAGLFSSGQSLTVGSDDQSAWACAHDAGSGPDGLAADRIGSRSAWHRLPSDSLGAVLDEEAVAGWLTRALLVLVSLPLPAPIRYAPAVGIEPVRSVSLGRVGDLPRPGAIFTTPPAPERIRIPADESVATEDIVSGTDMVAEHLAARLVRTVRQGTRPS